MAELRTPRLGAAILERIDALAEISEEPGKLTRTFLTPEHRRANDLVESWMRRAGMATRIDAIGNVIGRYEGRRAGLPALILGSHLDTVRDAGKYDGMLGVVTAIACVEEIHRARTRLPFAIEVIGFGDEEGVRFGATLLGSKAVAGSFEARLLDCLDNRNSTLAEALQRFGLDPAAIATAAHRPQDVLAYIELHIEQGPVLETRGLPVGCVTSINGATRAKIEITGIAGHAGTVPMHGRRDALAAAAQCAITVEDRCRREPELVGTVGRLDVTPGAINVIPGVAQFWLDIRSPDDGQRHRAVADIVRDFKSICRRRRTSLDVRIAHDVPAAPCAPWLMNQIDGAIASEGASPFRLSSGAGHDGMAIIGIADIGMIFVRCARGVSHNPAESITQEDADFGARVLLHFVRQFTSNRTA